MGAQKTLRVPAGWVWKGDLEVWRGTARYQEVGLHKKVEGWLQMPGHCGTSMGQNWERGRVLNSGVKWYASCLETHPQKAGGLSGRFKCRSKCKLRPFSGFRIRMGPGWGRAPGMQSRGQNPETWENGRGKCPWSSKERQEGNGRREQEG